MHRVIQYAVASLLVGLCLQACCEAQLTFSPGWRARILSKDVSARSESSGKRAGTWNSAWRWKSFPKRDGEEMVATENPSSGTLMALTKTKPAVGQADLDAACRLLESHLARLFFVEVNVSLAPSFHFELYISLEFEDLILLLSWF